MTHRSAVLVAIVATLATAQSVRAGCPSCDTVIVLKGDQVRCLERRLADSLKRGRDPIIVSIANCDGAKDEPRMDPPADIAGPRLRKTTPPQQRAFFLSRTGAECLVRKLAERPRRAKEFTWDEKTC